jgi:hypothetical protein
MKHKILELRAQGAQIDAAARGATPPRRHLEAVREATSAAKPLGLVWVLTPSYSITTAGLKITPVLWRRHTHTPPRLGATYL